MFDMVQIGGVDLIERTKSEYLQQVGNMGDRVLTEERNWVMQDLADERLLELKKGERLWKIYLFKPASGRATRLEHRIYTKLKGDGRLALATFAVHTPQAGLLVRSGIARVPDLLPEHLDRIIESIRVQTHTGPEEYQEIDLSGMGSLDEQLAYLGKDEGRGQPCT